MEWLEFLADCGQRLWQMLPLNPTGPGNSPYQSSSSLAGHPLFIGLEELRREGLLEAKDFEGYPTSPGPNHISYETICPVRMKLLRRAAERFLSEGDRRDFDRFCTEEAHWLDDHALFSVLTDRHPGQPWTAWPEPYRRRDGVALRRIREESAREWDTHRALQYIFQRQWRNVRERARTLGIRLVGDIPIFIAHGSADVWAHPELFALQEDGHPRAVAGVPPDYFSATGQRWGNPLYRWERHRQSGYEWWAMRLRRSLQLFDTVRIDHFRGFADYWEIPAQEPTAIEGRWVEGPGEEFFTTMAKRLGPLPLIAEDLGILSDRAIALRDRLGLPGLRVLLFAFDDYHPDSPFLPENFVENCVACSGTHDNDTILGTFFGAGGNGNDPGDLRARRREILAMALPERHRNRPIADGLLAWLAESRARWVIFPMQDILHLDGRSRTNVPGTATGNWAWKLAPGDLERVDREFLRSLGRR
jgi:4-alpha-glucanotransferase